MSNLLLPLLLVIVGTGTNYSQKPSTESKGSHCEVKIECKRFWIDTPVCGKGVYTEDDTGNVVLILVGLDCNGKRIQQFNTIWYMVAKSSHIDIHQCRDRLNCKVPEKYLLPRGDRKFVVLVTEKNIAKHLEIKLKYIKDRKHGSTQDRNENYEYQIEIQKKKVKDLLKLLNGILRNRKHENDNHGLKEESQYTKEFDKLHSNKDIGKVTKENDSIAESVKTEKVEENRNKTIGNNSLKKIELPNSENDGDKVKIVNKYTNNQLHGQKYIGGQVNESQKAKAKQNRNKNSKNDRNVHYLNKEEKIIQQNQYTEGKGQDNRKIENVIDSKNESDDTGAEKAEENRNKMSGNTVLKDNALPYSKYDENLHYFQTKDKIKNENKYTNDKVHGHKGKSQDNRKIENESVDTGAEKAEENRNKISGNNVLKDKALPDSKYDGIIHYFKTKNKIKNENKYTNDKVHGHKSKSQDKRKNENVRHSKKESVDTGPKKAGENWNQVSGNTFLEVNSLFDSEYYGNIHNFDTEDKIKNKNKYTNDKVHDNKGKGQDNRKVSKVNDLKDKSDDTEKAEENRNKKNGNKGLLNNALPDSEYDGNIHYLNTEDKIKKEKKYIEDKVHSPRDKEKVENVNASKDQSVDNEAEKADEKEKKKSVNKVLKNIALLDSEKDGNIHHSNTESMLSVHEDTKPAAPIDVKGEENHQNKDDNKILNKIYDNDSQLRGGTKYETLNLINMYNEKDDVLFALSYKHDGNVKSKNRKYENGNNDIHDLVDKVSIYELRTTENPANRYGNGKQYSETVGSFSRLETKPTSITPLNKKPINDINIKRSKQITENLIKSLDAMLSPVPEELDIKDSTEDTDFNLIPRPPVLLIDSSDPKRKQPKYLPRHLPKSKTIFKGNNRNLKKEILIITHSDIHGMGKKKERNKQKSFTKKDNNKGNDVFSTNSNPGNAPISTLNFKNEILNIPSYYERKVPQLMSNSPKEYYTPKTDKIATKQPPVVQDKLHYNSSGLNSTNMGVIYHGTLNSNRTAWHGKYMRVPKHKLHELKEVFLRSKSKLRNDIMKHHVTNTRNKLKEKDQQLKQREMFADKKIDDMKRELMFQTISNNQKAREKDSELKAKIVSKVKDLDEKVKELVEGKSHAQKMKKIYNDFKEREKLRSKNFKTPVGNSRVKQKESIQLGPAVDTTIGNTMENGKGVIKIIQRTKSLDISRKPIKTEAVGLKNSMVRNAQRLTIEEMRKAYKNTKEISDDWTHNHFHPNKLYAQKPNAIRKDTFIKPDIRIRTPVNSNHIIKNPEELVQQENLYFHNRIYEDASSLKDRLGCNKSPKIDKKTESALSSIEGNIYRILAKKSHVDFKNGNKLQKQVHDATFKVIVDSLKKSCKIQLHDDERIGKLTEWGHWGNCSVACGEGGFQLRKRSCTTNKCIGSLWDVKECSKHTPCRANWMKWSSWGPCSSSCDKGYATKTRICVSQVQNVKCSGNFIKVQSCNTHRCQKMNYWTEWSLWSGCSVSCGYGFQERLRECKLQVTPKTSLPPCEGSSYDRRLCVHSSCNGGSGAILDSISKFPSVALICDRATREHSNYVVWKTPDRNIITSKTQTDRIKISGPYLIIHNLKESDRGLYKCALLSKLPYTISTNDCRSHLCLNGGQCIEQSHIGVSNSLFVCVCKSGYGGVYCTEDSGSRNGSIVGLVFLVIILGIAKALLVYLCCRCRKSVEIKIVKDKTKEDDSKKSVLNMLKTVFRRKREDKVDGRKENGKPKPPQKTENVTEVKAERETLPKNVTNPSLNKEQSSTSRKTLLGVRSSLKDNINNLLDGVTQVIKKGSANVVSSKTRVVENTGNSLDNIIQGIKKHIPGTSKDKLPPSSKNSQTFDEKSENTNELSTDSNSDTTVFSIYDTDSAENSENMTTDISNYSFGVTKYYPISIAKPVTTDNKLDKSRKKSSEDLANSFLDCTREIWSSETNISCPRNVPSIHPDIQLHSTSSTDSAFGKKPEILYSGIIEMGTTGDHVLKQVQFNTSSDRSVENKVDQVTAERREINQLEIRQIDITNSDTSKLHNTQVKTIETSESVNDKEKCTDSKGVQGEATGSVSDDPNERELLSRLEILSYEFKKIDDTVYCNTHKTRILIEALNNSRKEMVICEHGFMPMLNDDEMFSICCRKHHLRILDLIDGYTAGYSKRQDEKNSVPSNFENSNIPSHTTNKISSMEEVKSMNISGHDKEGLISMDGFEGMLAPKGTDKWYSAPLSRPQSDSVNPAQLVLPKKDDAKSHLSSEHDKRRSTSPITIDSLLKSISIKPSTSVDSVESKKSHQTSSSSISMLPSQNTDNGELYSTPLSPPQSDNFKCFQMVLPQKEAKSSFTSEHDKRRSTSPITIDSLLKSISIKHSTSVDSVEGKKSHQTSSSSISMLPSQNTDKGKVFTTPLSPPQSDNFKCSPMVLPQKEAKYSFTSEHDKESSSPITIYSVLKPIKCSTSVDSVESKKSIQISPSSILILPTQRTDEEGFYSTPLSPSQSDNFKCSKMLLSQKEEAKSNHATEHDKESSSPITIYSVLKPIKRSTSVDSVESKKSNQTSSSSILIPPLQSTDKRGLYSTSLSPSQPGSFKSSMMVLPQKEDAKASITSEHDKGNVSSIKIDSVLKSIKHSKSVDSIENNKCTDKGELYSTSLSLPQFDNFKCSPMLLSQKEEAKSNLATEQDNERSSPITIYSVLKPIKRSTSVDSVESKKSNQTSSSSILIPPLQRTDKRELYSTSLSPSQPGSFKSSLMVLPQKEEAKASITSEHHKGNSSSIKIDSVLKSIKHSKSVDSIESNKYTDKRGLYSTSLSPPESDFFNSSLMVPTKKKKNNSNFISEHDTGGFSPSRSDCFLKSNCNTSFKSAGSFAVKRSHQTSSSSVSVRSSQDTVKGVLHSGLLSPSQSDTKYNLTSEHDKGISLPITSDFVLKCITSSSSTAVGSVESKTFYQTSARSRPNLSPEDIYKVELYSTPSVDSVESKISHQTSSSCISMLPPQNTDKGELCHTPVSPPQSNNFKCSPMVLPQKAKSSLTSEHDTGTSLPIMIDYVLTSVTITPTTSVGSEESKIYYQTSSKSKPMLPTQDTEKLNAPLSPLQSNCINRSPMIPPQKEEARSNLSRKVKQQSSSSILSPQRSDKLEVYSSALSPPLYGSYDSTSMVPPPKEEAKSYFNSEHHKRSSLTMDDFFLKSITITPSSSTPVGCVESKTFYQTSARSRPKLSPEDTYNVELYSTPSVDSVESKISHQTSSSSIAMLPPQNTDKGELYTTPLSPPQSDNFKCSPMVLPLKAKSSLTSEHDTGTSLPIMIDSVLTSITITPTTSIGSEESKISHQTSSRSKPMLTTQGTEKLNAPLSPLQSNCINRSPMIPPQKEEARSNLSIKVKQQSSSSILSPQRSDKLEVYSSALSPPLYGSYDSTLMVPPPKEEAKSNFTSEHHKRSSLPTDDFFLKSITITPSTSGDTFESKKSNQTSSKLLISSVTIQPKDQAEFSYASSASPQSDETKNITETKLSFQSNNWDVCESKVDQEMEEDFQNLKKADPHYLSHFQTVSTPNRAEKKIMITQEPPLKNHEKHDVSNVSLRSMPDLDESQNFNPLGNLSQDSQNTTNASNYMSMMSATEKGQSSLEDENRGFEGEKSVNLSDLHYTFSPEATDDGSPITNSGSPQKKPGYVPMNPYSITYDESETSSTKITSSSQTSTISSYGSLMDSPSKGTTCISKDSIHNKVIDVQGNGESCSSSDQLTSHSNETSHKDSTKRKALSDADSANTSHSNSPHSNPSLHLDDDSLVQTAGSVKRLSALFMSPTHIPDSPEMVNKSKIVTGEPKKEKSSQIPSEKASTDPAHGSILPKSVSVTERCTQYSQYIRQNTESTVNEGISEDTMPLESELTETNQNFRCTVTESPFQIFKSNSISSSSSFYSDNDTPTLLPCATNIPDQFAQSSSEISDSCVTEVSFNTKFCDDAGDVYDEYININKFSRIMRPIPEEDSLDESIDFKSPYTSTTEFESVIDSESNILGPSGSDYKSPWPSDYWLNKNEAEDNDHVPDETESNNSCLYDGNARVSSPLWSSFYMDDDKSD